MRNIIAGARIAPRLVFAAYLPAILLLVAVAVLSAQNNQPIGNWTRDPATIGHLHPLTGFVSNIGVLLWCTAAVISFFSAYLLRRAAQSEEAKFFFFGGCLSMFLALDDLFEFHEALAEDFFGLREKRVMIILGLAVLAYLFRFRKSILGRPWGPLFLAFALLGTSVMVDEVLFRYLPDLGDWYLLVEDGLKFLGIAAWCAYFVHRAGVSLTSPAASS